jgi:RimJ/RimL family protein N-acetyltransferase
VTAEPVVLRTARLVLDQPREQDVDAIFEYCQDPLFERYMTVPWPYTRADAESFVRDSVPNGRANGTEETFALRLADDGPLLGVIGSRSALQDIGYWLGAPHRGNGYLGEAVQAVLAHRFLTGQQTVHWECVVGNVASARVARRAGFRFSGTRPSRIPSRDGTLPAAWHAEVSSGDERSPQPGWPDELG